MLRRICTAGLAAALVIGFSTIAWAQGRGGGSSMGTGMSAFGSSGMGGLGSSGFGGSGMGGFGSSGFGGGGMSAFGSSGFGGSGFGGMGMGSSAFGGSGMGGSGFGSGMGGGQGGGQSFIGRDSGDMSAVFNQMGRAGTQFFNQMNRNSRGQNRNQRNAQSSDNAKSEVRVQLNLAFNHTRPAPSVVANTVRTRLANILPAQGVAQPDVTVDGDVVVLRGVATSENQRLVLEKLIAMEPGVMSVRNEMTVAPTTSDENR